MLKTTKKVLKTTTILLVFCLTIACSSGSGGSSDNESMSQEDIVINSAQDSLAIAQTLSALTSELVEISHPSSNVELNPTHNNFYEIKPAISIQEIENNSNLSENTAIRLSCNKIYKSAEEIKQLFRNSNSIPTGTILEFIKTRSTLTNGLKTVYSFGHLQEPLTLLYHDDNTFSVSGNAIVTKSGAINYTATAQFKQTKFPLYNTVISSTELEKELFNNEFPIQLNIDNKSYEVHISNKNRSIKSKIGNREHSISIDTPTSSTPNFNENQQQIKILEDEAYALMNQKKARSALKKWDAIYKLNPKHATANLFLGLDKIADFVEDKAIQQIIKDIDKATTINVIELPKSIDDFYDEPTSEEKPHPKLTAPEKFYRDITPLTQLFNISTLNAVYEKSRPVIENTILPKLDEIITHMNHLSDIPNFQFIASGPWTTLDKPIEIDRGDILLFLSALSLTKGVLHQAMAYDFSISNTNFATEEGLLKHNPNFGTLRPNGRTHMALALQNLKRSTQSTLDAIDAIESETDDQADDIMTKKEIDKINLSSYKEFIGKVNRSLGGETVSFELTASEKTGRYNRKKYVYQIDDIEKTPYEFKENIEINLANFFKNPITNIRNYLEINDTSLIDETSFPAEYDFSLNGLFPNLSSFQDWKKYNFFDYSFLSGHNEVLLNTFPGIDSNTNLYLDNIYFPDNDAIGLVTGEISYLIKFSLNEEKPKIEKILNINKSWADKESVRIGKLIGIKKYTYNNINDQIDLYTKELEFVRTITIDKNQVFDIDNDRLIIASTQNIQIYTITPSNELIDQGTFSISLPKNYEIQVLNSILVSKKNFEIKLFDISDLNNIQEIKTIDAQFVVDLTPDGIVVENNPKCEIYDFNKDNPNPIQTFNFKGIPDISVSSKWLTVIGQDAGDSTKIELYKRNSTALTFQIHKKFKYLKVLKDGFVSDKYLVTSSKDSSDNTYVKFLKLD